MVQSGSPSGMLYSWASFRADVFIILLCVDDGMWKCSSSPSLHSLLIVMGLTLSSFAACPVVRTFGRIFCFSFLFGFAFFSESLVCFFLALVFFVSELFVFFFIFIWV